MKTITESIKETLKEDDQNLLLESHDESELNPEQKDEYHKFLDKLDEIYDKDGLEGVAKFIQKSKNDDVDEGFLGGMAGFLAGPSVGKIVAKALGVEHGIFYDLLTSRLVSAALGASLQKEFTKK